MVKFAQILRLLKEKNKIYYKFFQYYIKKIRFLLFYNINCFLNYINGFLANLVKFKFYLIRKKVKIKRFGGNNGPKIIYNIFIPLKLYGKSGKIITVNIKIMPKISHEMICITGSFANDAFISQCSNIIKSILNSAFMSRRYRKFLIGLKISFS